MLRVVHVELAEANDFVARVHRHHKPVTGHRWSVGVEKDGVLCGVAIVGRPVARKVDQRNTVEVLRCCTDGTKNACSFLYGTAARVAKDLGYYKIQTYILAGDEDGTSLKAAGWRMEAESRGGLWVRSDGAPRRTDQPTAPKVRWAKILREVATV